MRQARQFEMKDFGRPLRMKFQIKLGLQHGTNCMQQKRSTVWAKLLNSIFPMSWGGKGGSQRFLTFPWDEWDEWDKKQCRISPIRPIRPISRSKARNLRGFRCHLSRSLNLKLLQQKLQAWIGEFVDNNME